MADATTDPGRPALGDDDGTAASRIRHLVGRALDPADKFQPADAVHAALTADVAHFLHPHFDDDAVMELLGTGVPASPGAASGRIVLTADAACEAADRGERVILVRRETSPEDVLGMQAAAAVLTARGGLASHAAVVARGWGIPAVVGLGTLLVDDDGADIGGQRFAEGDVISVDGHTGEVYRGGASVGTAAMPPELVTLLGWADALRAGHVGVRANADDAAAAGHARTLGAEGIGLCRTEHMFLADDRLPLVRRLILSSDPADDAAALIDLEAVQQQDFEALLREMDGLPVTIRLLDPPLHEFLPDLEPLVVAEALGQLDETGRAELAAVRRMHEENPMIGTRGVRLGLVKPGLYPMQVRAVARAVGALRAAGRRPLVEIMIPLVVDQTELTMARQWVEAALASVEDGSGASGTVSIGTMIETPRAAIVAGALAQTADFFSFGTNDLTQLTFAFSRDDVEAELLPKYLDAGLLPHNPFSVLDRQGVGFLVRLAVEAARAAKPSIKIGACGEQAGDPESAAFLVASGLDYVSCSPFRLPVVRLAVAQALLALGVAHRDAVPSPSPTDATGAGEAAAGDPTLSADRFEILHALRIKAFASATTVADMIDCPEALVAAGLASLLDAELVRYMEARDLWGLTPAGKEHHAGLLPGASLDAVDALAPPYRRFLELNVDFKQLCSDWQLRDGAVNDHSDEAYDRGCVVRLVDHDEQAESVLVDLATAVPRLSTYRPRLASARKRVEGGTTEAFTGVMKRSYHDVWMELHEDLICVLGIDRAAEGSF